MKMCCCSTHLDVVDGEDAYHGIVFSLVPVLIDLPPDEDNISFLKRQFPAWKRRNKRMSSGWVRRLENVVPGVLSHEVVEATSYYFRLGSSVSLRLVLAARTAHRHRLIIHKVIVTVQRDRRFHEWPIRKLRSQNLQTVKTRATDVKLSMWRRDSISSSSWMYFRRRSCS